MAQPGGTGSTLGNITAKAEQLRKIRTRLGMNQAGQAQTSLQPAAPTRGVPATASGQEEALDIEGQIAEAIKRQEPQLLDNIRRNLPNLMQQGPEGQAAAGPIESAPAPQVQSPFDYLQPEAEPLQDRLRSIGAISVSPLEQFQRLAGRAPSPRELAMFNGRMILEQQLGRPPTPTELKLYMLRPEEEDTSFQRAFEV